MLKEDRTIIPERVTLYNDVVKAVQSEKIVIYVEGEAFEKLLEDAKVSKKSKTNKKVGTATVIGSLLLPTAPISIAVLAVGGIAAIAGAAADNFKKYNIQINNTASRIELYLKKGKKKYDPKHDIIMEQGR